MKRDAEANTCEGCFHSTKSYKGFWCEARKKKVKKADACDKWKQKEERS